jgi:hypothetical protein
MTAYRLLESLDIFERLKTLFPEFVETAKEIKVIPWKKDFQVSDRNPEVFETIEFYNQLLQNSLITEEQYQNYINQVLSEVQGPISRTEGIAFTATKEVSFRTSRPAPSTIIHEIGHIHYLETDPIWSATYAGGESLMQLALWKGYTTNDSAIRNYHRLLHEAAVHPDRVAKELAIFIKNKVSFNCYPHLYALELFSGTVPLDLMPQLQERNLMHLFTELTNPDWEKIQVSYSGIRAFFANIMAGLNWQDPFSVQYAKAMGLIL